MRHIANDYHARDVEAFLGEILPERFAARRYEDLLIAILNWAEDLAYEHGEERFECGREDGAESGYDRGWTDCENDRSLTSASDMAQTWRHRFRERGWDVMVFDGAHDDIALEMSEQVAWDLLMTEGVG